MKKIILVFVSAIAVFCSCAKEDFSQVSDVEYVEVSVHSFLEGVELVAEEPITKGSASRDVYGIQIYMNDVDPYYSGMYDDMSLCKSIKLVKGVSYRVISVYIPNAKDYFSNLGKDGCWPFCPWSCDMSFTQFELNKDYYNSTTRFEGFSHELIGLGYNGKKRDVDYYVFHQRGYVAEEGKPLEINYLRYNGDITINFERADEIFSKVKVTTEDAYYTKTVTLVNGEGQYQILNHILLYLREEENIRVTVSTEDGKTIFYDGYLVFKRNKNRIYTIKLMSHENSTSVNVSYDSGRGEDEYMGAV